MRLRMTLERKLFLLSALALLFLLAVAAAGYVAAVRLSGSSEQLQTDASALKHQLLADMAHEGLLATAYAAMYAGTTGETARQREVEADLKDHSGLFHRSLESLDALPLGPAAREAVTQLRPVLDAYVRDASTVVELAFTDRTAAAQRLDAFKQSFKNVEREMANLSEILAQRSQRSKENLAASEAESRQARGSIVVTLALATILLLGVSWVVSRDIARRLRAAVQLSEAVAEGDLRRRLEVSGNDEIAQLLSALDRMSEGLSGLVGTVYRTSENIATGTAQIAAGNQDLSQRTEEQASSLEETAASMEQIASSVRSSAEATRKATGLASEASRSTDSGAAAVNLLVETMGSISEASRRITEITGVIDGIAFQTNILALNAAVEAARAGDQGRGFAVVAGEVRTLAQRSAVAAREIKELIDGTVRKVAVGDEHAGRASAAMQEMTGAVRGMTQLIGEISHINEEQSKGIAEVTQAVATIDQTTQKNASLVEEAAAAAASLKQQAAELVQAVARFRLGGPDGAARPERAALADAAPQARPYSLTYS